MYQKDFKNIQTIIRVSKEITDLKTGEIKSKVEYLIANFKTDAKEFYDLILEHWRVETYHYHLDTLTKEDKHTAYVDPFSMSILRNFTINLYQLYYNENRDAKIMNKKISMSKIKEKAGLDIEFMMELFEVK